MKNTGIYINEDFSVFKGHHGTQKVKMGKSFGISATNFHMPKLQEHHSKGLEWRKIKIELFYFLSVTLSFKNGRYN